MPRLVPEPNVTRRQDLRGGGVPPHVAAPRREAVSWHAGRRCGVRQPDARSCHRRAGLAQHGFRVIHGDRRPVPAERQDPVGQRPGGSTWCSTRTIVAARDARSSAKPLEECGRPGRIEVGRWFVEDEERGLGAMTPASASRCCSPPDSVRTRRRSNPPSPARTGAGDAFQHPSADQPRFSSPNATSSPPGPSRSAPPGPGTPAPRRPRGPRARMRPSPGRRWSAIPSAIRRYRGGRGPQRPGRTCSCPSRTGRRPAGTHPGRPSTSTPWSAGAGDARYVNPKSRASRRTGRAAAGGGRRGDGQPGTPSRTPARRRERTRAIDAAGQQDETGHRHRDADHDEDVRAHSPRTRRRRRGRTRRPRSRARDRQHREAPRPVEREREHDLGRGALDKTGKQGVDTPRAAEQGGQPRSHDLREKRCPGLADDQRRNEHGHEPAPYRMFCAGPTNSTARQTAPKAQKTTPNATPMTAATTMSRVLQRASGRGERGSAQCCGHVPNLLDAERAAIATGTASTSRRACFLRRYEPDQVPRVCGGCHTLSARGAPRRRCSVVHRS